MTHLTRRLGAILALVAAFTLAACNGDATGSVGNGKFPADAGILGVYIWGEGLGAYSEKARDPFVTVDRNETVTITVGCPQIARQPDSVLPADFSANPWVYTHNSAVLRVHHDPGCPG